jgi:hypothetical protein
MKKLFASTPIHEIFNIEVLVKMQNFKVEGNDGWWSRSHNFSSQINVKSQKRNHKKEKRIAKKLDGVKKIF